MKMKIALCLSGQMRTYERCFPYLKKYILDELNPDIFIHTWSNSGVCTKEGEMEQEERVTYDKLKRLYRPKKVVIEEFDPEYKEKMGGIEIPDKLKLMEPKSYKGSIPMFYKIWACNELKRNFEENNNFKYDLVIRLRPDFLLLEKLPEKVLRNRRTIWVPDYAIDISCQVSDKFAVSSSEKMDHYSSVWKHLKRYWKTPLGTGKRKEHRVGERLLKHHLRDEDIKVFFITGHILRPGKEISYPRKFAAFKKNARRALNIAKASLKERKWLV